MLATNVTSKKNKFGQYFTPEIIADFMIDLSSVAKTARILEPSCGQGVFLEKLYQKGYNNLTAYEIDTDLARNFSCVRYESFVSASIHEKFDLIIGNPPYIRWKNLEESLKQELTHHLLWNRYFNALCDYLYLFILKSIELLEDGGQLIFICPEYWMNTTHSLSLRNYMSSNGYFEQIYHFNETPIFDKVAISTIIFKFIKTRHKKEKIQLVKFNANQKITLEILDALRHKKELENVCYLEISSFLPNERWILETDATRQELAVLEKNCEKKEASTLLFEEDRAIFDTIGDVCDIGNGLVSGLDKAFQIPEDQLKQLNARELSATLEVVKAKHLSPFYYNNITHYIFIKENLTEELFKESYPFFYAHLQPYKKDLNHCYLYNRDIPYWAWVFPRNINLFLKEENRIFVPCKERISHKKYFRFALIEKGIFPTQDVTALFKKANIHWKV